jgi:hypothetical protein
MVHQTTGCSFNGFSSLETLFFTHFQLPICYETKTKLLMSLSQSTTTHISIHINERRRWCRIIRAKILEQILLDWFMKSLLPQIAKDVAMSRDVTKEKVIFHA